VLGLCINKNWSLETRTRVQAAISQGFTKRGIALIGGDTVVGDVGMFSTTLLGSLENENSKPLLRSAVKPGDTLYVNGTLGKSGAGLWLLMNHPEAKDEFPTLVEYHLSPKICESAGAELLRLGAGGACMDISDGLSSELNHLALSSNVDLQIIENKLPIDPEVTRLCEKYGQNPLNFALNGGEEYHLLFANSSPKSIFKANTQLGEVCEIGFAVEKSAGDPVNMLCKNGEKMPVQPRAWSHL
jgi:thiamine-monophosphate kinase